MSRRDDFDKLAKGDIIWNYYSLTPPYELSKFSENNLLQLFILVINYPIFFIEVFCHKIFWFLARFRPYYSELNNFILISSSIYFYFLL